MDTFPFGQYQIPMILDCGERHSQLATLKPEVPLQRRMSRRPLDQDLRLTSRRNDVHMGRPVIA
jgi:hypothetical protein